VDRDGRLTAKFWIAPVRLARGGRFPAVELSLIATIVTRLEPEIEEAWRGHFAE
jgi:hypothetical protein